jgi:hypothetical protein
MTSASFAAFILLPVIIDLPGLYTTRSGETVIVTSASSRYDFGCRGIYGNAVREGWHKSGRLLFGSLTDNDIVGAACAKGPELRPKEAHAPRD